MYMQIQSFLIQKSHFSRGRASQQSVRGYVICKREIAVFWGYAIVENETSEMGVSANLSLKEAGGSVAPQLGPDANTLKFEATYQTDSRMRITVTNNEQFEVPHDVVPRNKPHAADVTTANGRLYDQLQLSSGTDNNFHFQIKRKSTGTTVFSTANFPLVFKEQFISMK